MSAIELNPWTRLAECFYATDISTLDLICRCATSIKFWLSLESLLWLVVKLSCVPNLLAVETNIQTSRLVVFFFRYVCTLTRSKAEKGSMMRCLREKRFQRWLGRFFIIFYHLRIFQFLSLAVISWYISKYRLVVYWILNFEYKNVNIDLIPKIQEKYFKEFLNFFYELKEYFSSWKKNFSIKFCWHRILTQICNLAFYIKYFTM